MRPSDTESPGAHCALAITVHPMMKMKASAARKQASINLAGCVRSGIEKVEGLLNAGDECLVHRAIDFSMSARPNVLKSGGAISDRSQRFAQSKPVLERSPARLFFRCDKKVAIERRARIATFL